MEEGAVADDVIVEPNQYREKPKNSRPRKNSVVGMVSSEGSEQYMSVPYGYPQRGAPANESTTQLELSTPPQERVIIVRIVDANALALMAFGFSTLMFSVFLCNWKGVGDSGAAEFGFAYLTDMLTWGVSVCLCVSGVIQGLNDDLLGFSSYLFHAAILGTIGYNFEEVLLGNTQSNFAMIAWFCFAAVWINLVFSVMAFRIAYMFGILYVTVANMWFFVGLNFHGVFPASEDNTPGVGGKVAGSMCFLVAIQCFYLLLPVLTGRGFLK